MHRRDNFSMELRIIRMTERIHILLVEDNPGDARLIADSLCQARNCTIALADTLAKAVEEAKRQLPDIVLLDLSLPDSYGMDTIHKAMALWPERPIVVLTGTQDEELGFMAIKMGIQDYLVKGQSPGSMLMRSVRYAIEHHRAQLEVTQAKQELEHRVQERTMELEQTLVALQEEFDERIRVSQAMQHNREVLHSVGELIPFGLWIADAAGGITYLSDSFLAMVGMTLEECRRFGWTSRMLPEERARFVSEWTQCVQDQNNWDYEYRLLDKDDRMRTILSRGFSFRVNGNVSFWAGINLDITERTEMEQEIMEVIDQERKQMGQEMVERSSGTLTAAALLVKSLIKEAPNSNYSDMATQVVDLINTAMSQNRAMARLVSPVVASGMPLEEMLSSLSRDIWALYGHQIQVALPQTASDMDNSAVQLAVYLVRESVMCMIEHGIKQSNVQLEASDSQARLRVWAEHWPVYEHPQSETKIRRARVLASKIGWAFRLMPIANEGTELQCTWSLQRQTTLDQAA